MDSQQCQETSGNLLWLEKSPSQFSPFLDLSRHPLLRWMVLPSASVGSNSNALCERPGGGQMTNQPAAHPTQPTKGGYTPGPCCAGLLWYKGEQRHQFGQPAGRGSPRLPRSRQAGAATGSQSGWLAFGGCQAGGSCTSPCLGE